MRQEYYFQVSFCFLKKLYVSRKQTVCSLVSTADRFLSTLLSDCFYVSRYWTKCVLKLLPSFPGCDVMIFESKLPFLIQAVFLHDQKVKIKI